MKANAIARIILWSLVIVVLIGLAIAVGGGGFGISIGSGFSSSISSGTVGGGSVDAAGVKELKIEWVGGSIQIVPADTDKISFSEEGVSDEKYRMVWEQRGDTLTLAACKSNTSLVSWSGFNNKDLTVTVPRDFVAREIDIEYVNASVTLENISADKLELEGVSGSCDLTGCQADTLRLGTVSGDVSYSGTAREVRLETVSGEGRLELDGTVRKIQLETVSGNLELKLPEDLGCSVDLDGVSGKVRGDYRSGSDCEIDVDTVSGDLIFQ